MALLHVTFPLFAAWDLHSPQALILLVVGMSIFFYSLLTRYEMGAVDLIPMELHCALDMLVGVLLIASPWFFGFAHSTYIPHLVLGAVHIVATLVSEAHLRGEWVKHL